MRGRDMASQPTDNYQAAIGYGTIKLAHTDKAYVLNADKITT